MKYKNISDTQSVHLKLGKVWVAIPPGKIGNVPDDVGKRHPNLEYAGTSESTKVEGDLNNDGIFNKKDVSLAAKTLRKSTKKKKKTL